MCLEPRWLLASTYASLTRDESRDYYVNVFRPLEQVVPSWDGSVVGGNPGTLGSAYSAAILARVNAFRHMAGLPDDLTLDPVFNRRAQAAALMMSANRDLSHFPPSTWTYYTEDGRIGAGSSNLFLQNSGTSAIDGYMSEGAPAGHRRWILYPPQDHIGIGDIPTPDGGFPRSNALYVVGGNGDLPDVPYVAWPPPGYLPWSLVPDAWSFAVAQGNPFGTLIDYSTASVTVSRNGVSLPVTIRSRGLSYGDPAIEWTVDGVTRTRPAGDVSYRVDLTHVGIGAGQFRDYTYTLNVFDPFPTSFSLSTDHIGVDELAGQVMLEVHRTGDTTDSALVPYSINPVTATVGLDYLQTGGTLYFSPGQVSKAIVIPLVDDGRHEPDESFTVLLGMPSNGASLDRSTVHITIHDDDPPPVRLLDIEGIQKKRSLSQVVVTFSGGLDPTKASRPSTYALRYAGRDGRFGTRDDQILKLSRASYDPRTNRVALTLSRPFRARGILQLVAKSRLLSSPSGQAIDGDGDGQPGGDGFRILPTLS